MATSIARCATGVNGAICAEKPDGGRKVLQKLRIQLALEWCVFSPRVNLTAARSS